MKSDPQTSQHCTGTPGLEVPHVLLTTTKYKNHQYCTHLCYCCSLNCSCFPLIFCSFSIIRMFVHVMISLLIWSSKTLLSGVGPGVKAGITFCAAVLVVTDVWTNNFTDSQRYSYSFQISQQGTHHHTQPYGVIFSICDQHEVWQGK